MDCPKCHNVMGQGRLLGDRYRIKWMNAADQLLLGIWATNSIELGSQVLGRPKVNGFRCANCQIILIDEAVA